MPWISLCVNSIRIFNIHGPVNISVAAIASSLGMKDSVISLIWVAAWNTPTSNPTASEVRSKGATPLVCCGLPALQ